MADETTRECACEDCDTVTWCSWEPLYSGDGVVGRWWLCNACVVRHAQEHAQEHARTADEPRAIVRAFARVMEAELARARAKHGPMHSHHEAYAVLLEELDEVWDEVKRQTPDPQRIIAELVQVAAMCARWAEDVCAPDGEAGES